MAYELPKLVYPYDAFEPIIDEATMRLHHDAHHKAYVDKFNQALERAPEFKDIPIEELLSSYQSLPLDIQADVRNHGGGHYNHSLFWDILSPQKNSPEGRIKEAIESQFNGFENFVSKFSEVAVKHFGSGYAWLCVDKNNRLVIKSLPNQDTPLPDGQTPLLLLDVWEHAYYLKYKNQRAAFVEAFWNIVNWKAVEQNFLNSELKIPSPKKEHPPAGSPEEIL